jgi:hypothetical protein
MTCSVTATSPSVTRAYVGASGFSYPEWRGSFYPADAKPPEFLGHYAQRLSAVELNNTFYRLPAEEQFRRWADATPERPRDDGFLRLLLDSLDPTFLVALDLRHPSWEGVEEGLPPNAVRVNQLEGAARFRYLRFSDHPYDDDALARAAETVRGLEVETYCLFSKGEADDHSPGGEPTAVTAERFARLLFAH